MRRTRDKADRLVHQRQARPGSQQDQHPCPSRTPSVTTSTAGRQDHRRIPDDDDFRGKLVPALRVRIPPPKQPAAGNGGRTLATPTAAAAPPTDGRRSRRTLSTDDRNSPTRRRSRCADELDDEIPF